MYHTATIRDNFTKVAEEKGTTYDQVVQDLVERWRIPANKFGNPDDLGAFVALFCSEFAGFVTGQSLVLDGGLTNSTF